MLDIDASSWLFCTKKKIHMLWEKKLVFFNVKMCSTLNYHFALKHVCPTFLLQGVTPIIVG